nr:MAG TPA: Focal adhesion kinase 1, linker1, FAK, LD2, LD4, PAXILLIN [Caudoviricetes sp.]
MTGFGLKVTSANKSSGGEIKFNNSSHGSGASGGSKGGGGGGGSPKTPKHADSKSYFDKKRYYTVTN